ncbi:MAG TPA: 3'-5' exonuclease [Bacilli bacterium]|nr:3'-5' exonuclease [Bacilli bacterium]
MNFQIDLNEMQLKAVETDSQHVRIIAGAGSGKTRVLTYRIAYLISEMNVAPWSILAITFTNKVANEMKQRVVKMLPEVNKDLTIKTFHSFAANFLRREIRVLGFPSTFSILDEDDQTKLIKDIVANMGFKRGDKIVGIALNYISKNKLKELYPDDIKITKPFFEDEKTCLEIYSTYEDEKAKSFSLDFDDLLLKTNYILQNYLDIRQKWQRRFSHILIDEFQDTNDVEYRMIKLLKSNDTSLYVVGDPDQTIYTWRGANQDIILGLIKEFSDVETIVLERNYRSTQNILDSANKLIAHNKLRVAKNLYTRSDKGEAVMVFSGPSSKGEADFVAREIQKLVKGENRHYSDIVVLYRSNYVTMEFEAAFVNRGIPYKIYGGQKFYQRREIKDVLAYFHLITNTKDNIAFERIINVPSRGIGDMTISKIKEEAEQESQCLYDYIKQTDPDKSSVLSKALFKLKSMIELIDLTREKINENDEVFSKTLEDMIWSTGYQEYILKEEDGDERIENIKALFADIRHFLKTNPESTFDEYLQNISLYSAQDDVIDGDFVTMMTVHTAKGLEYPIVFVVRFNDGVFPHSRSVAESGYRGLEEERRLAYVAMTRAKEKLFLTFSADYSYVLGGRLLPSQFLAESGNNVAQSIDTYNPFRSNKAPKEYKFDDGPNLDFSKDEPIRQDFLKPTNDIENWAEGDIVIHKTFGKGKIIGLEGDGIIKVLFEDHGIKSLMGNHPAITRGGHKA